MTWFEKKPGAGDRVSRSRCHGIGLQGVKEQTQIPVSGPAYALAKVSQLPGDPVVKPWFNHWYRCSELP